MTVALGTSTGFLLSILPEIVLTLWALVLLLAVGWRHRDDADQRLIGQLAVLGLLSSLMVVLWMWVREVRPDGLAPMVALDAFRYATSALFLLGAIIASLISLGYLGRERMLVPEYYVLILFATLGTMFMGSGTDLIVIFLGLELMSICVYVLAGINRRVASGAESALKYFLIGAFASGFFLYGVALIYGATGTTNLSLIHVQIVNLDLSNNVMLLAGLGLLLIGFGFKVAAVPFHMWAPDVYDGAPTPVTAYMATAVKAAGFAALARVLLHAFGGDVAIWMEVVWWLAAITMIVGNLVALAQTQLKRMPTNLSLIHVQIVNLDLSNNVMLLAGLGLLLIGFGFKVAAVPFHMWAPDVYDGAPTPVTAYMATAVKAAGFAALARVLLHAFGGDVAIWMEVVWWLAAITMIVGNLVALAQTQLKRMLAYSSIGHTGYLLVAVASGTELGASAMLFYLLVYTLMTAGSFAILAAAGRDGERSVRIDDLSGLASQRPWLAFAMAVFMLSLLGFPGTAGFIGKWGILSSIIQADQIVLVVILVLASVVSAGYYLPVVMVMYMKPAESVAAHEGTRVLGMARWVIGIATFLLLLFGIWPNRVMDLARSGTDGLRPIPTQVFTNQPPATAR